MQAKVPQVTYAEHVHILELTDALDDAERSKVEQLLNYGPDQNLPEKTGDPGVIVVPRTGTISPWSSKATDIFRICQLDKVVRVERGVRWYFLPGTDLSAVAMESLRDRL